MHVLMALATSCAIPAEPVDVIDIDAAARHGWDAAALQHVIDEANEIGSAAVLVMTDGEVILSYGDVARPYRAHSIRKSMLDAIIGIGIEHGELDLNDTLGMLGITEDDRLTEAERQATLLDLAQSRSAVFLPAASETPAMQAARPERGSGEHGEQFHYNNWGFNVLGHAVEQSIGMPLAEAFDQWVAGPTGMCDFSTDLTWYQYVDESIYPSFKFRISARDLALFGEAYLDAINGEDSVVTHDWAMSASQTVSTASSRGSKSGYSRLWWTTRTPRPEWDGETVSGSFTASGVGGQRLTILPAINTIVVHRVDSDADSDVRVRIGTSRYDRFLTAVLDAREGATRRN